MGENARAGQGLTRNILQEVRPLFANPVNIRRRCIRRGRDGPRCHPGLFVGWFARDAVIRVIDTLEDQAGEVSVDNAVDDIACNFARGHQI